MMMMVVVVVMVHLMVIMVVMIRTRKFWWQTLMCSVSTLSITRCSLQVWALQVLIVIGNWNGSGLKLLVKDSNWKCVSFKATTLKI